MQATQILDMVMIISLAVLALTSIIFVIFLIPVLIQAAKAIAAVNALIKSTQDYVKGLTLGISSFGENIFNLGSKVLSIFNRR